MEYPKFLTEPAVEQLLSTLDLEQVAQLLIRGSDVIYEVTDNMDLAHLVLNALGSQIADRLTDDQTVLFRGLLHEHGECSEVGDG